MEKKLGPHIAENCIDCHMPLEQTNAIVSLGHLEESNSALKAILTRAEESWL